MNSQPAPPSDFLGALRLALGEAHVLPRQAADGGPDDDCGPFVTDWRQRYQGKALAIALPGSTQEVASVVRLCMAHGVTIVPQGGNTSLVGGSVPDNTARQLVLSLRRLNRVRSVDPSNLSMTVEAGCLLAHVHDAAEQAELLFPLSLASEGSCTVGGNLASNAGGTQVLRYGTARELCLGLEVVTPQGDIWRGLTALRKDNSGYALRDLFVGSEGTLGIITAASLRLYPRPAGRATALVACPSLKAAVALLHQARSRLDAGLTGFEAMQQRALSLLQRHLPAQAEPMRGLCGGSSLLPPTWLVLLEHIHPQAHEAAHDGLAALLQQAIEEGLASNATMAHTTAQGRAMWALREAIPSAERLEGPMIKHDIAVPSSAVATFASRCEAALEQSFPGTRIVCFGHLGDGNLHYNVQAPLGANEHEFISQHEADINAIVFDLAISLGGTISAEHGIGQLRRMELAKRKDPVALQLMRAIKQAIDPQNIMNPGRML